MTGLGFTPDRRDLRDSGTGIEPRDQVRARAARYSQWDGSQAVPDLAADEILDALADDMMAEGDIESALRRLMERGWRSPDSTRGDMAGLRDLMDRLARRREELLDRYKLGDVLADVRRELDEIVADERAGVEQRLDRAAGKQAPPPAEAPDGAPPSGEEPVDPALRAMLRDAAAKRLDQLDELPPDVGGRIRSLEEYDFM
jgi:hypothetical protein